MSRSRASYHRASRSRGPRPHPLASATVRRRHGCCTWRPATIAPNIRIEDVTRARRSKHRHDLQQSGPEPDDRLRTVGWHRDSRYMIRDIRSTGQPGDNRARSGSHPTHRPPATAVEPGAGSGIGVPPVGGGGSRRTAGVAATARRRYRPTAAPRAGRARAPGRRTRRSQRQPRAGPPGPPDDDTARRAQRVLGAHRRRQYLIAPALPRAQPRWIDPVALEPCWPVLAPGCAGSQCTSKIVKLPMSRTASSCGVARSA